jgi:hypothetical protein
MKDSSTITFKEIDRITYKGIVRTVTLVEEKVNGKTVKVTRVYTPSL